MMISYEPPKQTLTDRGLKRTALLPYMSSRTLTKLDKNEVVKTSTIEKICKVLHCQVWDVMIYRDEDPLSGV